MKSHLGIFTVLFALIHFTATLALAEQKKYNEAIMFDGGGMETATFLGMYEAAIEQGHKPDVILATCGGSLAAALTTMFKNTEDMKSFLKSSEFYEKLKVIQDSKGAEIQNVIRLVGGVETARSGTDRAFLTSYLLNVPFDYITDVIPGNFSSETPIVTIAAKIDGNRFKETFFTDSSTAGLLSDLQSPTSSFSKGGVIESETEIRSDVSLGLAVRASITDPFLMQPPTIGDDSYVGGVSDLYSMETAHRLADHVITMYSKEPEHLVKARIIRDVFGMNVFDRLQYVSEQEADYWVDFTDYDQFLLKQGFDPTIGVGGFFKNLFGNLFTHPGQINLDLIRPDFPSTLDAYQTKVDNQWDYGRSRMLEALAHPHDQSHIRDAEKYNTSKKTLKLLKREKKDEDFLL